MLTDDEMRGQVKGITLEELAERLGRTVRFGGEGRWAYSVLQHSLAVGKLLDCWKYPAGIVLAGLMHDASEAWCGDVRRPFKTDDMAEQEARLLPVIYAELELPDLSAYVREAHAVHEADDAVAVAEAHLLGIHGEWCDVTRVLQPAADATEVMLPLSGGGNSGLKLAELDFVQRVRELALEVKQA